MTQTNARGRLLVVGHATPGTGLAQVLYACAKHLARRWRTHLFGYGLRRISPHRTENVEQTIVPFNETDPETVARFRSAIQDVTPDAVLLLGQPWKTVPLIETAARANPRGAPLVLYLPIEGECCRPDALDSLVHIDHCVLYTQFARDNLESLLNGSGPGLSTIPHGLDRRQFCSLMPDGGVPSAALRSQLRAALFPALPELQDAHLVLNTNRPYWRKRLDLTVAGFARFLAMTGVDAYLYLHAPGINRYERDQLLGQAMELGISRRMLLNHLNPTGRILPVETLNRLLNASDVGITTAMGEGWGLGSFEHAATGAAQIVPRHTTFLENWDGVATFFPADTPIDVEHERSRMFAGSVEDIGSALAEPLTCDATRMELSRRAQAHATRDGQDWADVAARFDALLVDLTG